MPSAICSVLDALAEVGADTEDAEPETTESDGDDEPPSEPKAPQTWPRFGGAFIFRWLCSPLRINVTGQLKREYRALAIHDRNNET